MRLFDKIFLFMMCSIGSPLFVIGGVEYIIMDAENVDLVGDMVAVDDPMALGGKYIESTVPGSGTAEFTFTVKGGDYVVWARAAASNPNPTSHDSFHVSVDGGAEDVWDLFEEDMASNPTTNLTYEKISLRCGGTFNNHLCKPMVMTLTEGTHTLKFRCADALSKLDRIIITSDQSYDALADDTSDDGFLSIGWTAPTTNEDSSTLDDLAGYKVHYGPSSGAYTVTLDVGLQTAATLTGLDHHKPYYLSVTAYDDSFNESSFSSELVWAYDDIDVDGMSDAWEVANFGGINEPAGEGSVDSDADGTSNYREYIAGTDPMDGLDGIEVLIETMGSEVKVSTQVSAALGTQYAGLQRYLTLEKCTDITLGDWTPVAGMEAIPATGQMESHLQVPNLPFCYRTTVWLQ